MDFTKRKFKFIFCECFALVTIKSKVLRRVSLYHNVKKTPACFIMRFTILIRSCFLAHSCVKEHAQCIPVGLDFGEIATTSNMDGTEYAVYAAPFGCRVWIATFLVSLYFVKSSMTLRSCGTIHHKLFLEHPNLFWNWRLVWYNVKIPKK